MEKIQFLNTFVNNCNMTECLDEIEKMISAEKKSYVVAVNTDVIIKIENDVLLKEITDNADMVLVDGKPLIWIAKKHKKPIKDKVSGSDMVPLLCKKAAEKGYTIFILGGKEGVAEQAKIKLEEQMPDIKIAGVYAPPLGFEKDENETKKINKLISDAKPDILLACLGCPKQEKFIYNNIDKYEAKVSICAGATVDFLAGNIKRAPKWMSNHGLEWLYRFFKEPKRLFKRYFIDDIKIFKLARKYRKLYE
ncbi:MAG: WecB/TagA/CpsF family glycosyltransferase [Clostridia bacterium]|nr:WecB/TagA/CpsF family glycosyltransferase [Clostridia bacterium]